MKRTKTLLAWLLVVLMLTSVVGFTSAAEELTYADVLIHVIDISNPEWETQAEVVDDLIRQLGAESTPCLRV